MSNRRCSVWFQPDGYRVDVPEGTGFLEAAAEAGHLIEAECGGKGTCGSCLMEVRAASPDGRPSEGDEPRLLYACQARVERDSLATPLGTAPGQRRSIVTGTSYLLRQRAELGPQELGSVCRRLHVQVPSPSIEFCLSDRERLVREVAKAADVGGAVTLDLEVLRSLPDTLRSDGGRVTVTLWCEGKTAAIMDVMPGFPEARHLGVACDLGTSTVVQNLLDLDTGKVLAVASDYNRQMSSGADVISRIDCASRPGGIDRLREQAVATINALLHSLCSTGTTATKDLRAMVVSGNTTMAHLLLGVQPRYIREEPYVPAFSDVPACSAAELGIEIEPRGRIYCVPAVGSFVGGDIVSGILCQRRIGRAGELFLFIDVGTNGEIVLGNDEWLMTCACSAGPAFEGSGVSCGIRSAPGAIERINLWPDGEVRGYDVIGGGKPQGLCGSALIQILGELLRTGLIDQRGRLSSDANHPRITRSGRALAFIVEHGTHTRSGADIVLTDGDIDNLVRAKAAIYSGCSLLLRKVGLTFQDLDAVYVAGGFGQCIAVEQAVAIGLLPDIDRARFVFLGNSSLAGARLILLSSKQRERCLDIARTMTYIELSAEPSYMDEYTAALFLPHT